MLTDVLEDLGAACELEIERIGLSAAQERFLEEAIVAVIRALKVKRERPRPKPRIKSCDPKVAGGDAHRFKLVACIAACVFTSCTRVAPPRKSAMT